jgi:hypothetical protein
VKVYVKRPAVVHPENNAERHMRVNACVCSSTKSFHNVYLKTQSRLLKLDAENLKNESTNYIDIDETPASRYLWHSAPGTLTAKLAIKGAPKKQRSYNISDINEKGSMDELVLVYEDDSPDENGGVIRKTIISSDPTESKVA